MLQAPPSPAPFVVQAPSPPITTIQYSVAPQNNAFFTSRIIWIAIVLVMSIGGGAARSCAHASRNVASSTLGTLAGPVWDGSKPFKCSGNDDVSFSGVQSVLPNDTAIQAAGSCHVRCTNCTISAAAAIEASGNAEVSLINGDVRGTIFLVNADGNARVTVSGNATVSGHVKKSGNARVSVPEPPAPTPPVVPSAPPLSTASSAPPSAPKTTPLKTPPKPPAAAPTPPPTRRQGSRGYSSY